MSDNENAISFNRVTIKATPVELLQCGRCLALIPEESMQGHTDWHGKLVNSNTMAALGFGVGLRPQL